jgi:SAM-dependent methyltransferase
MGFLLTDSRTVSSLTLKRLSARSLSDKSFSEIVHEESRLRAGTLHFGGLESVGNSEERAAFDLEKLYRNRFHGCGHERRTQLWKVLCKSFFQGYVKPTDCVLDLAAGYCEFINNIACGRKIAVDLNVETVNYAAADVQIITCSSTNLEPVRDESVDLVFVSNFFEHLPSKLDLLTTLEEIKRVLIPGGKVLILQPNIRLLKGAYWDFLDHHLPLSDRSLVEALELVEMKPIEVRPRFLPYTTKSRLPQYEWLVRLYLRLPMAQWLFGKQAWVVAVKPKGA